MSSSQQALKRLDESPLSGFHLKTVITAGMGFCTDAHDLFIIGVVSSILKTTWHISSTRHFLIRLMKAAGISLQGFLLTFVLPEPYQKSLESFEKEGEQVDQAAARELRWRGRKGLSGFLRAGALCGKMTHRIEQT